MKIDHFGNIITNIHRDDFPDLDKRDFHLTVGPHTIDVLAHNYAETGPGELFLIWGSGGYLEISLAQASAAALMKCESGAPAELIVG